MPPTGSLLSPTGKPVIAPPQARLVPMLAAALVEQGFSAIEAVRLAERAWERQGAGTSPRMAERAEKHAADVEQMRSAERERVAEVHGGTVAPLLELRTDLPVE